MIVKNYFKKFNIFLFIFSLYVSTIWINFFYLSSRNVDFFYYYDYLNYFIGAGKNFKTGQGTFYYFLISLLFKNKFELVSESNIEIILSYSVQSVNLFFYLIGIYGIYKLLKLYKIESSLIFLSLSILNFFPQTIYIRAVMKPEIIAFSFLPWIIYFLKCYKNEKQIIYLLLIIPFLTLVLISKPSIAGMTLVYLTFFYSNYVKFVKPKTIIILFLILFSFIIFSHLESFLITSNYFFEREYDLNYDNVAPFNIIYKFSFIKIFTQPFFDYEYQLGKYSTHSNSVLNITILDTFGDYFTQLFDYNGNYFSQNRKNLFTTEGESLISSSRVIKYNGPLGLLLETNLDLIRKAISSILSILFYIYLVFLIITDKKNRDIYAMPFFGILVLYISSLGIPTKNFNPFLGDTFKTFYYSFLISITFIFLITKILNKLKFLKTFFVFFWIVLILFVAGHPKGYNQEFSEYLIRSNQYSSFCEVNNFLIFQNELVEKIHKSGNQNKLVSDCNPKVSPVVKNADGNYFGLDGQECVKDNEINTDLSSRDFCRYSVVSYLKHNGSNFFSIIYPYFSTICFVLILAIVAFENKFTKKFSSKYNT